MARRLFAVSVRDLVDFTLRSGDLGGSGQFVSSTRALEGTLGHQRVQRSRPDHYQTEVSVRTEIDAGVFTLRIQGRIDGLLVEGDQLTIEEIKTVAGAWNGTADPLHWAQLKVYAHLYLEKNPFSKVRLRLCYLELDTDRLAELEETASPETLRSLFEKTVGEYLRWLHEYTLWLDNRDASIQSLPFPFAHYRAGQRQLAVAAYRTLAKGKKLFVEAPTGIGKTISVLFPAVKCLGEGHFSKIFYLTAKTPGRTVAEKALADMRSRGLRIRSVTLTAREKICFNNGLPCDVLSCPFAIGYHDRIKNAMRDAFQAESLMRETIESVARRHQVCPFELSLDCTLWADAVICDYNYVFDPGAYLRRFFQEEGGDYAFLIDEAHNLIERAREMFSADLDKAEVLETRRALPQHLRGCAKALGKVQRQMVHLRKRAELSGGLLALPEKPEELLKSLEVLQSEAEAWLALNEAAPVRELLLALYFRVRAFLSTGDLYDRRFTTLCEARGNDFRVRLFCLDPSELLNKALERGQGVTFFSATLTPMDYFKQVLGGTTEDATLHLSSPFPPENLRVLIADRISTSYRERASSYAQVAECIAALVKPKRGNYLVYFPSYEYLRQVHEAFTQQHSHLRTLSQKTAMTETEREDFIAQFRADAPETLVGFAIMGGVFGEGIDLLGERLSGAVIVGVGLPQVCLERNLMRDYFEKEYGAGFDYAYMYPGMNRVLQAVGRVIRSERDRGLVLLIDSRFRQLRYRELFPATWQLSYTRSSEEIHAEAAKFWHEEQNSDSETG